MKKSKIKIIKLTILMLVILIPLLAGYFIGIYSYNRYKSIYFYEYMDKAEENTEAKLEAYLKFYTHSYDEEVYYEELVKKDGEDVLKFVVYRALLNKEKQNSDGSKTVEQKLTYIFTVFDINYKKLLEIKDPSGDEKLEYNKLPKIFINVQDNEFNGNSTNLTMDHPQDLVFIADYAASPELDDNGRKINSKYLRWAQIQIDPAFSDDISVKVFMGDPEDIDEVETEILSFTKEDFFQVTEQIDASNFIKGASEDIEAAGYLAHVIKTKIWWQSLITIVLVALITSSFYIVWKAEDEYKKEKKEVRK